MSTPGGLRFMLVTTAKNEAPYFLEWVAYHKLIGFDTICVFQNDSDDGTHEILRELSDLGEITYAYNRAKRGAHQVRAYKRAARQQAYLEADWAMALDMDEFLTITAPGGTVRDLISALPDADQIHLNWRLFSSSGHAEMTDELVIERFTRCDPPDQVVETYTGVKTLFRPAKFIRPGIHKPVPREDSTNLVTINGSGLDKSGFEMRKWRSLDPGKRAFAQVNHYILRDAASFVLKRWRGSAHQADRAVGKKYWRTHNRHAFEDLRLPHYAPMVRAEMARMDARSGGALMAMRRAAINHHRDCFRQLRNDPGFAEIYRYCLADIASETPVAPA
ncbi:MAG: glycosyltransferase family 2 protein [Pseudomonadota bacterium]